MKYEHSCIGVFTKHTDAEKAVKELEKSGFNMKDISIVGKGYHSDEHPIGYYNTGDRVMFWGKWGALWGGLWGMLFGSAFFWIPGLGALAVAGPLVATIVGGAEGATIVGGLNALGAALYSIGIPKDSIIKYETSLKADKFLLITHGAQEKVESARDLLNRIGAEEVEIHNSWLGYAFNAGHVGLIRHGGVQNSFSYAVSDTLKRVTPVGYELKTGRSPYL